MKIDCNLTMIWRCEKKEIQIKMITNCYVQAATKKTKNQISFIIYDFPSNVHSKIIIVDNADSLGIGKSIYKFSAALFID